MYLSGAAFSAGILGLPDVGLFTLTELVQQTTYLTRASDLPLIVDADTGFGETLNVERTIIELEAAGARRIAIVAHSMGGLSSRYFVKSLGGTGRVSVYTSLGTMHHGLRNPCTAPVPVCVWQELCSSGTFIADLNATPATPRPTAWTSIFSDSDNTVPVTSSELEGATNILVNGLEHDGVNGLQDSEEVYRLVVQSLQ